MLVRVDPLIGHGVADVIELGDGVLLPAVDVVEGVETAVEGEAALVGEVDGGGAGYDILFGHISH